MMKNGSSAPIPRHLNGWIAGIVEEVSHQTSELESMRVQIAELKATRQEEVIEFSKVTEEWAEREKNFKAEINRLEHIISDTQQGAESVMLARAESVVNRNDGRAFRAKLERLSRSDEGDGHALEESHPADDNLVEQGKRKCVALSPGDIGLAINTTPYEVLESTPSLLDDNDDIHLSKQLRDTTPRRDHDWKAAGS
ncbi:hypothetical protein UCDDA912_g10427 [Diaporthe ampelina]|uniref:Uncharacterized protein n=1 Tax=Diaporthe ampelina TaxID=1214573 RepID=A0A0G2HN03_9PEZI|nr:hypothetical protein UCDDA912_g10427 [Diaporthe ampelina]